MRLSKLELTGFKSFAKPTTLSFGASITAIVGPNGSGKSNIAEAFRFALGEQSMKTLRGKRGEDLIFAGTPSVSRANRAQVALAFDNAGGEFGDLAFPEVSVSRAVFRDGANEYGMNGSQVRLKDIQELLAKANIGETGHHIISQGEADRILSAHPRERRAMLEEALGLRIYHFRKEEALRKLEKTEENLREVSRVRRELAPHLRFLEKQVEKAERAKSLREELVALYREYLAREDAYIAAERARITAALEEPERERALLAKEERARKDAPTAATPALDALTRAEAALSAARSAYEDARSAVARAEGALEALEAPREEGPSSARVPFSDLESLRSELLRYEDDASRARDEEGLRKVVAVALRAVRGFIDRYHARAEGGVDQDAAAMRTLHERIERLRGELVEKKRAVEACDGAVAAARAEIAEEGRRAREEDREFYARKTRLVELEAAIARLSGLRDTLEEVARELEREHAEALAVCGSAAVSYEKRPYEEEPRRAQEERKLALTRVKIRLEESGALGEDVLKEFEETAAREAYLAREVEDLERSAESLKGLAKELDRELSLGFAEGLGKINAAFRQFFVAMFGGGTAALTEVSISRRARGEDEDGEEGEEDAERGIEISVSIPKKRVSGLIALSGGERALTSIALIFAMSQVNPPPFLILDETDAALDEANSRRYGDMIEELAKKSQLIVITHNRETMSRASILYGVTMGADGVSRLLSVRFEEAAAVAKR